MERYKLVYRILLNPAGGGPQFVRVIYDKPETGGENERDERRNRANGRKGGSEKG